MKGLFKNFSTTDNKTLILALRQKNISMKQDRKTEKRSK